MKRLVILVVSVFFLSSCFWFYKPQTNSTNVDADYQSNQIVDISPTPDEDAVVPEITEPAIDPINKESFEQTIIDEPIVERDVIGLEDFNEDNVTLHIPKINIDTLVKAAEIDDGYMLTDSHDYPLWIPEWSEDIGQYGISIIYGHRQWGIEHRIFSKIDELRAGDIVVINTKYLTFNYVVSESIVIKDPELVWDEIQKRNTEVVLNNQSQVALLTCTPWGTDWNRLIVFAVLQEGG